MAGTDLWPSARKDIEHNLDQAKNKQPDKQAASAGVDKVDAGAPKGCAEELASFLKTYAKYGQDITPLPTQEDKVVAARCRRHVNTFEQLAYADFLEKLPGWRRRLKREVANWLGTCDGLLMTLDTLEMIEGSDDEVAMAYKAEYEWVKPKWEVIVNGMGLSTADCAAVREFKAKCDGSMFLKSYEKPEEALRVLEGDTVLVGLLEEYRQPLINLLKSLIKLRSAGAAAK